MRSLFQIVKGVRNKAGLTRAKGKSIRLKFWNNVEHSACGLLFARIYGFIVTSVWLKNGFFVLKFKHGIQLTSIYFVWIQKYCNTFEHGFGFDNSIMKMF